MNIKKEGYKMKFECRFWFWISCILLGMLIGSYYNLYELENRALENHVVWYDDNGKMMFKGEVE